VNSSSPGVLFFWVTIVASFSLLVIDLGDLYPLGSILDIHICLEIGHFF
jgi:hypothetical protein